MSYDIIAFKGGKGNHCFRKPALVALFILIALALRGAVSTDDTNAYVISLPGGVKLEMRKCPAGKYIMGQSAEMLIGITPCNPAHLFQQSPKCQVTIDKPFWLGKYEVTQAQWKAVMNTSPSNDLAAFPDNPVDYVTPNLALEFCRRLNNDKTIKRPAGYKFGMPTREQWEYACRAGTTTLLNNGRNLTPAQKQIEFIKGKGETRTVKYLSGGEMIAACGDYNHGFIKYIRDNNYSIHAPVGKLKPNRWGLYDMHGLVSELCRGYGQYYPTCGGDFYHSIGEATSVSYGLVSREDTNFHIGFRLALVPICKLQSTSPFKTMTVKTKKSPDERNKILEIQEGVALKLSWIPAGDFIMGTPFTEQISSYGEFQHWVRISKDFWMGTCKVTKAQFEAVFKVKPPNSTGDADTDYAQGFTYEKARDFCRILNQRLADKLPEGYEFNLPTEAQWEYACRAGTKTTWYTGDEWPFTVQRFDDKVPETLKTIRKMNYCTKDSATGKREFKDKSLIKPNAWGLEDMYMAPAEICRDFYAPYPEKPLEDPEGPPNGFLRIVRGIDDNEGRHSDVRSHYFIPESVRSASRGYFRKAHSWLGFRVALVPKKQEISAPRKKSY